MDLLDLRVHTSRLIGQDENLVLHGGGNTSVKINDLIYVKASGWNLDTIERAGFAPVKQQALLDLLALDSLSDTDMVRLQREAMPDQSFPNPSVEAILHALIPFTFVDHTHADAIVTISNSTRGKAILEEIYPHNFLILPYVMPGFVLAKQVAEATKHIDWSTLEGIILLNHGVFTFNEDGMKSYQKMLDVVKVAEDYLATHTHIEHVSANRQHNIDSILPALRACKGHDIVAIVNTSDIAQTFASRSDLSIAQAGVLTPEHIIRTKQMPVIFDTHYAEDIEDFARNYMAYFHRHATHETMLNPCPNWGVLKGMGTISFAKTDKEAHIIQDINNHTMMAMLRAEQLGGYISLNEADSFAMEYWELEQAKLRAK
jgi:rhamnose utilization protein RhaD (predicted bifunctional aldolase and dehydrogenase)